MSRVSLLFLLALFVACVLADEDLSDSVKTRGHNPRQYRCRGRNCHPSKPCNGRYCSHPRPLPCMGRDCPHPDKPCNGRDCPHPSKPCNGGNCPRNPSTFPPRRRCPCQCVPRRAAKRQCNELKYIHCSVVRYRSRPGERRRTGFTCCEKAPTKPHPKPSPPACPCGCYTKRAARMQCRKISFRCSMYRKHSCSRGKKWTCCKTMAPSPSRNSKPSPSPKVSMGSMPSPSAGKCPCGCYKNKQEAKKKCMPFMRRGCFVFRKSGCRGGNGRDGWTCCEKVGGSGPSLNPSPSVMETMMPSPSVMETAMPSPSEKPYLGCPCTCALEEEARAQCAAGCFSKCSVKRKYGCPEGKGYTCCGYGN